MNKKNKESLMIYGTNFAGSFIPKVGSLFNPVGSIIFGSIDIAKRLYDKVDNPYVRAVETLGAVGYSISAVSNILSSLNGDIPRLGSGVLDASMAYQLLVNEGVLSNIKSGQIKNDFKQIKTDLEGIISKNKKDSKNTDDYDL